MKAECEKKSVEFQGMYLNIGNVLVAEHILLETNI